MRPDGLDRAYTEPVETALIGVGSIPMGAEAVGSYAAGKG